MDKSVQHPDGGLDHLYSNTPVRLGGGWARLVAASVTIMFRQPHVADLAHPKRGNDRQRKREAFLIASPISVNGSAGSDTIPI